MSQAHPSPTVRRGVTSATRFPLRATAVACGLFLLGAAAQAQQAETTLPEVVVSASGFEQKITDAPASISVITQEELAKKPYLTLLDAVRDVEGVDVGETRDKTGQGTISMRGMGSDYTLILVDGKRQNNHGDIYPNNFGGNQFGHVPPMDAIERIEVIRGPASTLYGADAMGGVINIITKKVAHKWSASVTHGRTFETDDAYGNDRTTDFYLSGPLVEGKIGLTLRGSVYNRDASNPRYASVADPAGFVWDRSLGFGGGGKTVDNENKALGARLSWALTDRQTVYFDVDTSRQTYDNTPRINDAGVAEYPVGTVDDYAAMLRLGTGANNGRVEPRAGYAPQQEFTRDTFSVTHEGKWSIGKSTVSLSHIATNNNGRTLPFNVAERQSLQTLWNTACVSAGGTVGGSGYCPTTGTGFNNNQSEAQKLAFMQANLSPAEYAALLAYLPRPKRTMESRQWTLDGKLDIPLGNHMVVVGAQAIRGELEDGVFGMEAGTPGGVQKHNMISVFAEDSWNIVPPFVLTSGLRYDHHNVFGNHVSPRLYGVYTINPSWTVKGGAATGFKTPKTTQLYDGVTGFGGQGVSPMFGNPNLKPETSLSNEIAVYWQHPRGHSFNATYFHNAFDDKIASQPCGPGEAQACNTTGDFGSIGYGPSASRSTNIDKVVIQGVELAGRWQIARHWGLRGNYTYTDSQQKSGTERGLPLGNTAKHMFNASVDWQASDKLSFLLSMQAFQDRFDKLHPITNQRVNFKDYHVFNLGASYQISKNVTLNGRINNLFDRNFTSYRAEFRDLDGNGNFQGTNEALFFDDYNNKEKARSFWVSLNVRF
ncbi:TonB-dependent receptor domain-containing protein [Hydrogenophaga sp. BPS33]|uniref:TonB-dependent receptor domain-containing protein n=1 Tax=Hydrogenophaga sp. BPS33 TaxID=2651974 RepID=UPI00131F4B94|nr:TonB-dependent receptor [Hydrogenophaga sp. BPS33]QHE86699.1 TonB-dependent receptor [Hydrogenophaga sp. BPS33]